MSKKQKIPIPPANVDIKFLEFFRHHRTVYFDGLMYKAIDLIRKHKDISWNKTISLALEKFILDFKEPFDMDNKEARNFIIRVQDLINERRKRGVVK